MLYSSYILCLLRLQANFLSSETPVSPPRLDLTFIDARWTRKEMLRDPLSVDIMLLVV